MAYKIPILVILASCSATGWKVADDIMEGEMQTVEKVADDLRMGDPMQGKKRPSVEIRTPLKEF